MSKTDLPESLCFFVGRERANKIKAKKRQHLTSKADKKSIFYGDIICNCIQVQIKKLKYVYLTYEGWKSLVFHQDSTNLCASHDIFYLGMKALYLMKFYKYSLQYYNKVSSFKDIASLAIMEINYYLNLLCDDTHDYYTINSPITLIHWF